MILQIAPEAKVRAMPEALATETSLDAIGQSTVVFGCVDNDAARLVLVHACSIHALPYFNAASEIIHGEYGGQVSVSINGESCLLCQGELNQTEIRLGLANQEERELDRLVYGVDRALLAGGGPAVVSVNGVVASLAVTEFLVWKTGLRLPKRLIKYHGAECQIRQSADHPISGCHYCKGIYGSKDLQSLRQFLPQPTDPSTVRPR
jgi:molybdopterin/thiamine biosynthesis adenylyltransferase